MSENQNFLDIKASPEQLVEEFRNGRMIILVDDENRENEGDLIIPAQMATPDAINFMARYGRGLICLSLTQAQSKKLGLSLMPQRDYSRYQTAFTLSIEAREGVTTGISTHDRAYTIAVAISADASEKTITTPGHVFPLIARPGGVLERAGHTEAAVDFSRLANLNPSAVICEIMNENGTMARRDDLIDFAKTHHLKIGSIADLIAYRLKSESLVVRKFEKDIITKYGPFRLVLYHDTMKLTQHVALVKGKIDKKKTVLVRMHALDFLVDICEAGYNQIPQPVLRKSMEIIAKEEHGVIVLLRGHEDDSLYLDEAGGTLDKAGANNVKDAQTIRYYGIGAQILMDLGVSEMDLLSNSGKTLIGFEGFDLSIKSWRLFDDF